MRHVFVSREKLRRDECDSYIGVGMECALRTAIHLQNRELCHVISCVDERQP